MDDAIARQNSPAPASTSWRSPRSAPRARPTSRRTASACRCIVGTPLAGETIDGETFDGSSETAIFPGDLPANPARLFEAGGPWNNDALDPLTFVRFKPPRLEQTAEGFTLSLPHIRLDRALQYLIGDKLA